MLASGIKQSGLLALLPDQHTALSGEWYSFLVCTRIIIKEYLMKAAVKFDYLVNSETKKRVNYLIQAS